MSVLYGWPSLNKYLPRWLVFARQHASGNCLALGSSLNEWTDNCRCRYCSHTESLISRKGREDTLLAPYHNMHAAQMRIVHAQYYRWGFARLPGSTAHFLISYDWQVIWSWSEVTENRIRYGPISNGDTATSGRFGICNHGNLSSNPISAFRSRPNLYVGETLLIH